MGTSQADDNRPLDLQSARGVHRADLVPQLNFDDDRDVVAQAGAAPRLEAADAESFHRFELQPRNKKHGRCGKSAHRGSDRASRPWAEGFESARGVNPTAFQAWASSQIALTMPFPSPSQSC